MIEADNIMTNRFIFAACLSTLLAGGRLALPADLPPPVVPDGLGVNIHFTDQKPGEMEMLLQAGFHWVRKDIDWNATEREKGKYYFSIHERLGSKQ